MTETSTAAPSGGSDRSTAVNGLLGGVASIVLAFLPFSPLLGGAVAGYLETEDGEALKAGAISGLVALVPLALLGLFVVPFFLGFGSMGFGLLAVFLFLLFAAYTVGLGALGGLLGAYLEDEL